MSINKDIFRAYDIRGIYPEQVNKEFAYKLGQAFVRFLNKKNLSIVVGRDNRISSPELHKALINGIIDSGADVIDIGLSTTPMLDFAIAYWDYDAGVNITSSHNPKEYNGFKLARENAIPISKDTGLFEIRELIEIKFCSSRKGKVIKREILSEYIKFNLKDFDVNKFKSFNIVVDTANAVAGILIPKLIEKVPIKIHHIFSKLDGNFPNHSPDPSNEKNLIFLQKEIKRKKADLGVAFDGDGDRIIFLDETGKVISGDLTCAFLADLILKENPGQKVLYNVCSSNIIKETVEKRKGIAIMGRVGHSFIKERMRREDIIFAGELSGHFYHKEHFFLEAPLFVLFKILEEMFNKKKKISELIKPLRRYFNSGEMNFSIKDSEFSSKEILELLEEKYCTGKISKIDGLRIDFNDYWFSVRLSNTEPLLRLIIEAKTKQLLSKKKKEIISFIK